MNNIELKTNGNIKTKEGREFTRLLGGFGEDKPIISDIQIAELLNYKNGARQVRQQIERNSRHFTEEHIIDLQRVAESDTLVETLISLGYAKQSITQSKSIYVLSQAGFLLYLKFAEGDNAVELYKNFIEDYFQTKAENLILKKTIDEEIDELKRQKALFLGMGIMEVDTIKQVELFKEMESVNNRINKLEKVLTQKQTVKELEPQLHIAKLVGEAKGYYDMGDFAKILGVDRLGRNNMFKYLRNKKILMSDNVPYQQYVKYFKVIPTVAENGFKSSKTLLRPNGVEYIVKKLIGDGRVVARPIDEIIKELEQSA